MAAVLETRKLDFWYGDKQALKAVDFAVQPNTVAALIGPSGCGKSTLLRTFNQIYRLYAGQRAGGELLFENSNLLDGKTDPMDLRSRIGMVFQKPTAFAMSIFDNVAFGIRLAERVGRSDLRARVEESLRAAALWDEVKDDLAKPGTSLSGGQQQRLCIARALGPRPAILLMDEPTSALDPVATAKVEDLMEGLKARTTIVIVTHNMQQAARVADTVSFMYLGEMVERGPTRDIFNSPREKRTRDYITGRFG